MLQEEISIDIPLYIHIIVELCVYVHSIYTYC